MCRRKALQERRATIEESLRRLEESQAVAASARPSAWYIFDACDSPTPMISPARRWSPVPCAKPSSRAIPSARCHSSRQQSSSERPCAAVTIAVGRPRYARSTDATPSAFIRPLVAHKRQEASVGKRMPDAGEVLCEKDDIAPPRLSGLRGTRCSRCRPCRCRNCWAGGTSRHRGIRSAR